MSLLRFNNQRGQHASVDAAHMRRYLQDSMDNLDADRAQGKYQYKHGVVDAQDFHAYRREFEIALQNQNWNAAEAAGGRRDTAIRMRAERAQKAMRTSSD